MNLHHLITSLRRLNELQCKPHAPWVSMLSDGERSLAIEQARRGVPTSILGHHDRMVQRGKRSLAIVQNGVCGACHLKLPIGRRKRMADGHVLDVCDHCGVFLEWTESPASSTTAVQSPSGEKPKRKSSRKKAQRENAEQ